MILMKKFILLLTGILFLSSALYPQVEPLEKPYKPEWQSIIKHQTPEWFKDAKFGIYFHWGVYTVPAFGNEWYPRNMYIENTREFKHHKENWGPQAEFGYKDFVPMFKARNFNAEEWMALFVKSGAKFVGPVAEHHDGFAMWDSKLTEWDAADIGPERDITGELKEAADKAGLKFMVSFHHARKWKQYEPAYKYDAKDHKYAQLYGQPHPEGMPEPKEYLDEWIGKIYEVIDNYRPDYIWFDFGWAQPPFEPYKREFLAHYYNKGEEWGKNVVVSYKNDHLPLGMAVLDLERGRLDSLSKRYWITDTSISKKSWCYVADIDYKDVNIMIDNLIDRVSKNGNTLMNIAPKTDGTIPDEQKERLLAIGEWLKVNGEAIYGTRHWFKYGEGPTRFKGGSFIDGKDIIYTSEDIRFTTKGNNLYAIALDWPESEIRIKSLGILESNKIKNVSMLGVDGNLDWELTEEGLAIRSPGKKPCEHAFSFKIEYSGRLPWIY